MKNLVLLLLTAVAFNCYSQKFNPLFDTDAALKREAKGYIKQADTLFAAHKYDEAASLYRKAYNNDQSNKYPKVMMDSCRAISYRNRLEKDRHESANGVIKQLKEKGAELIFNGGDYALFVKNKEGQVKSVDSLETHTRNQIMNVKREYWESYK